MPIKAMSPIFGLSASMKIKARVATAEMYSWLVHSPCKSAACSEVKVFEKRLAEVGAWDHVGLFDSTVDGRMPSMIRERAEESLVD